MEPSQISHTTAPFCPAVAGCPAFGDVVLLPALEEAVMAAGTTGLTESDGLLDNAEAVERGSGVIEMLGC